jgi:hypothetical protein
MADEHDHSHGEEKKNPEKKEEKLNLSAQEQEKLSKFKKNDELSHLVGDLYAKASSDYNNSADLKKKDVNYVLQLAQKIGQYKAAVKKARGMMGLLKYYLGGGYNAKFLREANYKIKKMEGWTKNFLYDLVGQSKDIRKAGLGAMKAYAAA